MATPRRILIAALLAFVVIVVLFKTNAVPRYVTLTLAVVFWAMFRWVSTQAAKTARMRREQELKDLRDKPVLGLDE